MSQQRIWTRLFLILLLALTAAVLPGQQGPGPAEDQGFKIGVEVNMVTVPVTDKAQAAGLLKLIETLEDLDDVQNVYMNAEIADEALPDDEG